MILSFVIPAWLSNFRRCNCSPFPACHGSFLTSGSPNQLPHPYHLLSRSSDPLFSNSILLVLLVSMYHLAVLGNELQDWKQRYMLWEPMNHFQSNVFPWVIHLDWKPTGMLNPAPVEEPHHRCSAWPLSHHSAHPQKQAQQSLHRRLDISLWVESIRYQYGIAWTSTLHYQDRLSMW